LPLLGLDPVWVRPRKDSLGTSNTADLARSVGLNFLMQTKAVSA